MPPIEGQVRYITNSTQAESIKLETEYLQRERIEIVGVNPNGSLLVVDTIYCTVTVI